jgi:hypothetical protein
VKGLVAAPHGDWLASAGNGGTLLVWDMTRGTCAAMRQLGGAVSACARGLDGRVLVATGDQGVYLFDLVRGEAL